MSDKLAVPVIANAYSRYARVVELSSRLLSWVDAIKSCEVDADRYLRKAKLLAKELLKDNDAVLTAPQIVSLATAVQGVTDVDEVPKLLGMSLTVPLPIPLSAIPPRSAGWSPKSTATPKLPSVVVAFTAFRLNGTPLMGAHTVDSDTIYDLGVDVGVSKWPEEGTELLLEPISVEPTSGYDFPTFKFCRPQQPPPYHLTGTGRMNLRSPASFLARPLEFTYRARFVPELRDVEVVTEGQRHLNFRPYDPEHDPQSGYVSVDRRLLEIRDQARGVPGVRDEELNSFLVLLSAVGSVAAEALQDNLFPQECTEGEFQSRLKGLLRARPRIGGELEEHPRAGGGVTDLSFRGVRLELKVASHQFATRETLLAHLPQVCQYTVGSDRRFGLLCLLDSFPKTQSPGVVSDDIALEVMAPPSGSGLPVCIGTIIVRGRLAMPSRL